jgi:phage-related protein
MGSALDDLREFPEAVRAVMGKALAQAQLGGKHEQAKPMSGLGSGVMEIVDSYDKNAYRSVYTVEFPEYICVLHSFQKKSKSGIATPRKDMNTVELRLKRAREDYKLWKSRRTK